MPLLVPDNEDNIFLALAQNLVKRGDDMADVARELGHAFRVIVTTGLGDSDIKTHQAELADLTKDIPF